MKSQEKINKSLWLFVETIKDVVSANVVAAVHANQLKVDAGQVERLVSLVNSSIDEGYGRGHKAFIKIINEAIDAGKCEHEVDLTDFVPTVTKKK